jgi:hypothetical protein
MILAGALNFPDPSAKSISTVILKIWIVGCDGRFPGVQRRESAQPLVLSPQLLGPDSRQTMGFPIDGVWVTSILENVQTTTS